MDQHRGAGLFSSRVKAARAMVALALVSLVLFGWRLNAPPTPTFDEAHYVPAAREFAQLGVNRNYEHPPLGKWIIAAGIKATGDHPTGWRIMSLVFGVATILGLFVWGWALFDDPWAASYAAALAILGQLVYVQ